MLVFGLVLIAFAVLAILAGVFTAGDRGDASLVGIHLGATSVFLVGLFAGLAILWGFSLTRYGTRRELRHRRDKKRLHELSAKLEERERHGAHERESDERDERDGHDARGDEDRA